MQLTAAVAFAALLLADRGDAHAEGPLVKRASSELATYSDSDHVTIFTPTIAGGVDSPTAGWSVKGRYLVDIVSAA